MKNEIMFGCSLALSISTFPSAENPAKSMKEVGLDVNTRGEGKDFILEEGLRGVSLLS